MLIDMDVHETLESIEQLRPYLDAIATRWTRHPFGDLTAITPAAWVPPHDFAGQPEGVLEIGSVCPLQ